MKTYDYYAVGYKGDIYCLKCLPKGVDVNSDEVSPIFADSEWDEYPTCGVCFEIHDYVSKIESGK